MARSHGAPSNGRGHRLAPGVAFVGLWWLPVAILALLASWGTLAAPLLSDDAAALGYVHGRGLLLDWFQPQYAMTQVRFWRPVVTSSLAIQEALTGVRPGPLRALNLLGHLLAALAVGGIVLRLGAPRAGALAAGALAATFPEQGGTVTWIVGRVDSLTVPLILGAVWLALALPPPRTVTDPPPPRSPRVRWGLGMGAFACAFLACGSKEIAFVLPALGALLGWARGSIRGARAAGAPLLAAAGVAFLWRRAAIGAWVGGYPPPGGGIPAAAAALIGTQGLALVAVAAAVVGAALGGGARLRGPVAAGAAALLAGVPVFGLLADGEVEEQNLRTLYLVDLLLCVAAGSVLRPGVRRSAWAVVAVCGLFAAARLGAARADTREWAEAGRVAESAIEGIRGRIADRPPSDHPLWVQGLPRHHGGAYCLAWGVADRFRAPFPPSPRPVWPLRTIFGRPSSERPATLAPEDGIADPFSPPAGPALPRLAVTLGGRPIEGALTVDERVARTPDSSPVLEVWGAFPAARFELVAYTEMGYEPAPWPGAGAGEPAVGSDGRPTRLRRLSLREILLAGGFVTIGQALTQAADAGATRAYLEIRVLDGERVVAASQLLALEWAPDLVHGLAGG